MGGLAIAAARPLTHEAASKTPDGLLGRQKIRHAGQKRDDIGARLGVRCVMARQEHIQILRPMLGRAVLDEVRKRFLLMADDTARLNQSLTHLRVGRPAFFASQRGRGKDQ